MLLKSYVEITYFTKINVSKHITNQGEKFKNKSMEYKQIER